MTFNAHDLAEKIANIEIGPLTGSRVFHNHVPMFNSCAARL